MPELIEPPDKNMSYAYGVWLLNNKHRLIRQTKKHVQPSAHGDRHWEVFLLVVQLNRGLDPDLPSRIFS